MHLRTRLILIVAAAVVSAACWHHRPSADSAPDTPATLHVDNHNYENVDIQVSYRGLRSHLGSVNASGTTDIVFPKYLLSDLGEVQLIAHAIGTPSTIETAVIVLKPGTKVRWTLETDLSRSSVSVY